MYNRPRGLVYISGSCCSKVHDDAAQNLKKKVYVLVQRAIFHSKFACVTQSYEYERVKSFH